MPENPGKKNHFKMLCVSTVCTGARLRVGRSMYVEIRGQRPVSLLGIF